MRQLKSPPAPCGIGQTHVFERGVGAGQACWGVPAADQPPCADHACKKGMAQGRLWVEGCVNSCVTVYEIPSLHTVDVASPLMAYGKSESYGAGSSSSLQIRTFDLSSAYRQVALSSRGRDCAYIAIFDPCNKQTAYFACRAVPFGVVRSAHSFLRLSRVIW